MMSTEYDKKQQDLQTLQVSKYKEANDKSKKKMWCTMTTTWENGKKMNKYTVQMERIQFSIPQKGTTHANSFRFIQFLHFSSVHHISAKKRLQKECKEYLIYFAIMSSMLWRKGMQ